MDSRIIALAVLVAGEIGCFLPLSAAETPVSDMGTPKEVRMYLALIAKNEGKSDGSLAVPHHRLAKIYAETGNSERAESHFGLALKSAVPRQIPGISADFADFLIQREELHRAENILRQALPHAPRNEHIVIRLARCLVLQEKIMEGLRYFKMIYSDTEAKRQVAMIYREQGDTDMLAAIGRKWETARIDDIVSPAGRSVPMLAAAPPVPAFKTPPAAPMAPALREQVNLPFPKVQTTAPPLPIPIPQPVFASQPVVRPPAANQTAASQTASVRYPKPAPQPAVIAGLSAPNPLNLPMLPLENLAKAAESEESDLPPVWERPKQKTAVSKTYVSQSRRHYVVNAHSTEEINRLFSVLPVAAAVPADEQ
ncbi:MAG: tetratricopeptide repeat protein [Planctomycetaceae bacterium]|jgi:hypothetical protein|nr:tetratricopeptide repeat protein [Planctomycetaceae bacterium]